MVATAVVVPVPLPMITGGSSARLTTAAEPAIWFRVADPWAEPAVASIVVVPTVVELLIAMWHVPKAPVVHDEGVSVTGAPVELKSTT